MLLVLVVTNAQSNDKESIMKVVNDVFEAMRTNDSTLLKSCFVENPNTFTVFRRDGETNFVSDDFQRFIDAVGRPKEEMWNEPIWNEKVEIDDDLASVWVDYAFYRGKNGDQFSHCGVDEFNLVKLDGTWRIFHLVDTRRREGCNIPDQIIPGNESTTILSSIDQLDFMGLVAERTQYNGRNAFAVSTSEGNDESGVSLLKGLNFSNGIIEADLIGFPKEGAPRTARGFIGIAFRIGDDNAYECFYIRPTNSGAENQLRRNHSVQYVAHPDYPWHRLRKEESGVYETYADIEMNVWTTLRIEVEGKKAKLFINNSDQPSLVVNDLKLGEDRSGGVGFWTFSTTEAYFSNLKITTKD